MSQVRVLLVLILITFCCVATSIYYISMVRPIDLSSVRVAADSDLLPVRVAGVVSVAGPWIYFGNSLHN